MWTLPPDAERLSSGEGPDEVWHRSHPLAGSDAEAYLAKRRVPLGVAAAADVRFTEDLEGRAACGRPGAAATGTARRVGSAPRISSAGSGATRRATWRS